MTFFQYLCSAVPLLRTAKVGNTTHKNKNMRQIKVTPEEREKLQVRFNAGANYITQVLSFSKHGPTAERIRRAALQMGGRYVDPEFAPNCRTEYLGGKIIQTFGANVVLTIDVKTGDIKLSQDAKLLESVESASMVVWNSMAIKAQDMAEKAMVSR